MRLIYGRFEPADPESFFLVAQRELERLRRAARCKTWGAFVKELGLTWRGVLRLYGEEIRQLAGESQPGPGAAFSLGEVWGAYYVGDRVVDPRQAAHDWTLERLSAEVRKPLEANGLQWGGSHPGGGVDCVTAKNGESFELLAAELKKAGMGGVVVVRDDAAIAAAFGPLYGESDAPDR